jgi:hypothetical protein
VSWTVIKPPQDNGRHRSTVKTAAVITAWLLCSLPAAAGPPSCPRELGHTDGTMIRSLLQLRGVAHAPQDQQCAALRQHAATLGKVREVLERCLSGAKKDVDLGEIAGVLDGANGMIARVCDDTRQSVGSARSDSAEMP